MGGVRGFSLTMNNLLQYNKMLIYAKKKKKKFTTAFFFIFI